MWWLCGAGGWALPLLLGLMGAGPPGGGPAGGQGAIRIGIRTAGALVGSGPGVGAVVVGAGVVGRVPCGGVTPAHAGDVPLALVIVAPCPLFLVRFVAYVADPRLSVIRCATDQLSLGETRGHSHWSVGDPASVVRGESAVCTCHGQCGAGLLSVAPFAAMAGGAWLDVRRRGDAWYTAQ